MIFGRSCAFGICSTMIPPPIKVISLILFIIANTGLKVTILCRGSFKEEEKKETIFKGVLNEQRTLFACLIMVIKINKLDIRHNFCTMIKG